MIKLTPIMQKIFTVILLLISAAFSIKAVDSKAADSLEIYYDGIYAVDWSVNVYPVADILFFDDSSISDILDVLDCRQKGPSQKRILADDGIRLLWHYFDVSFENALNFKSELEKVDLPDGYKWGFGFYETEKQELALIIAICKLNSAFSDTIYQAFLEENVFGKPSVRFNFRQGESEEPLDEYRRYKKQSNHLLFEINGWLFSYSQIKDNDGSITIDYVPRFILEKLYKSPRFDVPELIAE
mgnify:CR=1 FL=1